MFVGPNEGRVDPLVLVTADSLLTERVVTDAGNEGHPRSKACGGDGLIGSLAAHAKMERMASQRLSWPGEPGCAERQIDIRRADDADAWNGPHRCFLLRQSGFLFGQPARRFWALIPSRRP